VILLFSDGEEAGLTGAAAFVREHPWARDVAAVLNLDSGGTRGQSIAYQIATANTDLVTPLRQTGVIGNSIVSSLFAILPYDTDVSELARLGQPAVSVGLVDGSQVYHTSVDDVSHLDAGSLQHHGAQVLALTRSLANGPLPRPRMDDAVFFTMPVLGMVAYPAKWAPLLAILAGVIVAIGVVRFARRTPGWFRDVALGFAGVIGTTVLGTSIAGGVGAVMERMLVPAPVMGWSDARGLSASGIALLVIALASVGWAVVRRWASRRGAHLGALAFVAVLALLVSWKLTGASFLFTVPTLAAGAAALVAERENGPAPTIARWIAVLVALFVIVPIAYSMAVVETGVGVAGAAVLGLLGSLTAWLLAPQLEALRTRHTWATPAVATGSAMLLLASVVAIARRGTNYPTPSMLAYAVDAESSAAWLLAPARFARAGSWSATVLGGSARLVRPSAPATIPGAAHTWLTRAIAGELPTLVASTRRVEVGVLDIVVVSDSIRDGERRLILRIRPAPGTYSVRLRAPGSRIDSAAVDGRVIEAPSNRSRPALWSLGYVTPPDEGFDLALSVRGHEPLEIEAITRSLGLPPAVAVALPQRPAGVVPVHAGDQTVVHRRFRF
jgi:hypothetical protein